MDTEFLKELIDLNIGHLLNGGEYVDLETNIQNRKEEIKSLTEALGYYKDRKVALDLKLGKLRKLKEELS